MSKSILFSGVDFNGTLPNVGYLVARAALGLTMAFAHGIGKLPPSERLIDTVDGLGFPMPLLFAWSAALSEFLGGIFVALGFLTRPAAAALIFTMLVAAFLVHADDPFQKKEFALVYLFGFLSVLSLGGGRFSVDASLGKRG